MSGAPLFLYLLVFALFLVMLESSLALNILQIVKDAGTENRSVIDLGLASVVDGQEKCRFVNADW